MANFALSRTAQGVDFNAIPTAALDRVEMLKDGASAIYGTDAIAGVINFITRKDFFGRRARRLLRSAAGSRRQSGARDAQHAGYGQLEH